MINDQNKEYFKKEDKQQCECCGETPCVGTRWTDGCDGGADLRVCEDCMETTEWDIGYNKKTGEWAK